MVATPCQHDLRGNVIQAGLENVGKSRLLQFVDLLVLASDGDRRGTDRLGDLHRRQAHAAGGSQEHHKVSLAQIGQIDQGTSCGGERHPGSGGNLPAHAFGVPDHSARRGDHHVAIQAVLVKHEGRDDADRVAYLAWHMLTLG